MTICKKNHLEPWQSFQKRAFDLTFSFVGLTFFSPVIALAFIASCIDTRSNGFFAQSRVGKDGKAFRVIKIKSMRSIKNYTSTVTHLNDPRITKLGKFLRKTKVDELPQPDIGGGHQAVFTARFPLCCVRPTGFRSLQ